MIARSRKRRNGVFPALRATILMADCQNSGEFGYTRRLCRPPHKSNGRTPPGTRCAAARKSAQAAPTATRRLSRNDSAGSRGIPMNTASIWWLDSGKTRRTTSKWSTAKNDLRQLDERPVSQGRSRPIHRAGLPGDGSGQLAYLSGADETAGATAICLKGDWRFPRFKIAGTFGGERASKTRNTDCRGSIFYDTLRPSPDSFPSSRCWRIWARWICKGSTGDRRRRERLHSTPPMGARRVGHQPAGSVQAGRRGVLL